MSYPVLFLDIDGVLNGHDYDEDAQSNLIGKGQVAFLNYVLGSTDARIVLSSAWRYMVLNGAMTLRGFEYLLRTHGVACVDRLIGTTGRDDQTEDPQERGRQIKAWLAEHPEVTRWAVVDDMDLGFSDMPFVKCDRDRGLTMAGALSLIELLGRPRVDAAARALRGSP